MYKRVCAIALFATEALRVALPVDVLRFVECARPARV